MPQVGVRPDATMPRNWPETGQDAIAGGRGMGRYPAKRPGRLALHLQLRDAPHVTSHHNANETAKLPDRSAQTAEKWPLAADSAGQSLKCPVGHLIHTMPMGHDESMLGHVKSV